MILQSRADEIVPFADSEELVANSGLSSKSLIEVGFEHRLTDEESLEAIRETVEGLNQSASPGPTILTDEQIADTL